MNRARRKESFPSAEYALLHRLEPLLNFAPSPTYPIGIGDDAAIRQCASGERLVLTADSQIEGVHFSLDHMTLTEVGYRAMAVNISDCAAMGARADAALVQVSFPRGGKPASEIEALYRGLGSACQEWGFPIIGGDLAAGPCWCIAVTMIGRLPRGGRPLLRRGARSGDRIWVSGTPGDSAAGLAALRAWGRTGASARYRRLVNRHIRPQPRIELAAVLSRSRRVHTAIDISDGVSKECRTTAYENSLGVVLHLPSFPVSRELLRLGRELGTDPIDWVLHGGEDYELLVCAGAGFVPPTQVGPAMTAVGQVTDRHRGVHVDMGEGNLIPLARKGWDHL